MSAPVVEEIRSPTDDSETFKKEPIALDSELKAGPPVYDGADDDVPEDALIVTGADAANYLIPIRDDHDPSLTFRSIFLATALSGFQAAMHQIYNVSCLTVMI